jgi:hypothetical protein
MFKFSLVDLLAVNIAAALVMSITRLCGASNLELWLVFLTVCVQYFGIRLIAELRK